MQRTPTSQTSSILNSPYSAGKVLVGSQTGTCTALGRQLVASAAQHGICLELQSLLDYEPEQLLQEKLVLLVLSTYEEGTPPTAAKYVAIVPTRRLESQALLIARCVGLNHAFIVQQPLCSGDWGLLLTAVITHNKCVATASLLAPPKCTNVNVIAYKMIRLTRPSKSQLWLFMLNFGQPSRCSCTTQGWFCRPTQC